VCDGWSLDVLLADLSRVYQGLVGAGLLATAPQHGFHDYVAYRDTAEVAARIAAGRDFWRKALESHPSFELRTDGHAPRDRTLAARQLSRLASRESVAAARAFSRAQGVSLFAVLLSTFAAVLNRATGATSVVIATTVAGHPDAGMEDCVGNLASLVPVWCRFDARQTFGDLCRASHEAIMSAREHAVLSVEELAPTLPVVFTHVQRYAPGKLPFAGCAVDYQLSARAFERFELGLTVVESRDDLELGLCGNVDRVGEEWLEQRLREFESILARGCKEPGAVLASLAPPLVVAGETAEPAAPHVAAGPARRPYATLLRDASRSLVTAFKLRDCALVGSGARVIGRVWIHGEGRVVLGERVLLDGTRAPIELHPSAGAEIVIGDDVVVEGGSSIEATHAVRIGARSHVGMYCKIMDSHFHDLGDRNRRPSSMPLVVEEDVVMGPHVILTSGAQVGRGTILEARTVVGRPIGPNLVARGIPARTHRQGGADVP
jgi:acetyltransferase-like isoleucine patch superfamily enzyme